MKVTQIIFLIFLSVLSSGCEWMETEEVSYPNYRSAVKVGAIGEGKWIPALLPQSAENIRESHNLDTNEIWLFFQFNLSELPLLIKDCTKTIKSEIVYPRKSSGDWWSQILIQKSGTQQTEVAYQYYRCNKGVMAIDLKKGEVFYWEPA